MNTLQLPAGVVIRAIVSDVDGTMTDGGVTLGDGPVSWRTFNTHDGYGHDLLHAAGVKIGWLSATGSGESIVARAKQLKVEFVDVGRGDKGERFIALCARMGVSPNEVLYLGDDLNDLPAMKLAGVTACPADAMEAVRAAVDVVLKKEGGRGAFREAADLVLGVLTAETQRSQRGT